MTPKKQKKSPTKELYKHEKNPTHALVLRQHCARLMTLVAKDNVLTDIPAWIATLSNLRTLQLARNDITSLPFQVAASSPYLFRHATISAP